MEKKRSLSENHKHKVMLAESIGHFIKYWGFKSIHGRIWCLLYLAEVPRDASFLMESLNVSKGLISMAMKDLIEHKVVLKCEDSKGQSETQCYMANPQVMEVITNVLQNRELQIITNVKKCHEKLASLNQNELCDLGINLERFKKLGEMTSLASYAIKGFANMEFEELKGFLEFNDQYQS